MADAAWIVGFHPVLGALQAGRDLDLVWVQRGRRDQRIHQVVVAARARGLEVRQMDRDALDRVAGGVPHNGCAARGAPATYISLEVALAAVSNAARVVVLDHVLDPHNVGAVIRTAAALGVQVVVVAGPSAPPLGGAMAKAAAGTLERVQLARERVAADAVVRLRDAGFWVFGADAGGPPLHRAEPTGRWALCLGAEAGGLRARTRKAVDELVAIPMSPGVESLNVSVAAGILLWGLGSRDGAGWGADADPKNGF